MILADHGAEVLAIEDQRFKKDSLPSIPGVQIADIAGGAMNGAVGILLALHARAKTGQGQYIDISMTDGMLDFLSLPNYLSTLTGRQPRVADTLLSHRYGCYNTTPIRLRMAQREVPLVYR